MRHRIFATILTIAFLQMGFGQNVTDFQFTTIDGQKGMLSDYQGQVTYISFWASWCHPCISNFKKYAEMRQQLSDIGITLLNVNIDKEKIDWTTALNKHQISGEHVRGIDLDSLQRQYQLYSIPVYEIINKKGGLVYLSDDPDRNIIEEFKKWINQ